jgi:hypothetical protein
MSFNAILAHGSTALNTALQFNFVQALGKNWIQHVPNKPAEGQSVEGPWYKLGDGEYHYHQPTKRTYRAETNDWALAKAMAIVFTGGFYAAYSCTAHMGTTVWETAKGVHSIYTDWQAYKVAQIADKEGTPKIALKEFVKNRLLGTDDAPSVLTSAIREGKQALKDYAMFNLFAINTIFLFNSILGYSLRANYSLVNLLPNVAFYLPAAIVAYSLYAPLESRVHLEKLQDWWRPEGVKPLTDSEVAKLSLLGTVKRLMIDGSISPTRLLKTGRLEDSEVVVAVKQEEENKAKKE